MKKLFVAEEVNTSRQVEFDIAKTVCIVLMIAIHCFEQLNYFSDHLDTQPLYYFFVIVMDALFCANIFVGSMGLGMSYSRNQDPESYIKRGFRLFCSGYLLNFLRITIPYTLLSCLGILPWKELFWWTISDDILQFGGLAFILFGFLKKIKCSDRTILFISLGMSIVGSLVRFVHFENTVVNQLVGLFIGTIDANLGDEASCFPLLNWFIIVVISYMYAKKLRHCSNIDRFYTLALPVSGVIVGTYMAYAIPNRFGMLSGNISQYYFLSTPNVLIMFSSLIFATSVYHFAAKLISDKLKAGIIKISNNLTPIYYVQWIIIGGIIYTTGAIMGWKNISTATVVFIAILVTMCSILLGVHCPKKIKSIIS